MHQTLTKYFVLQFVGNCVGSECKNHVVPTIILDFMNYDADDGGDDDQKQLFVKQFVLGNTIYKHITRISCKIMTSGNIKRLFGVRVGGKC